MMISIQTTRFRSACMAALGCRSITYPARGRRRETRPP